MEAKTFFESINKANDKHVQLTYVHHLAQGVDIVLSTK